LKKYLEIGVRKREETEMNVDDESNLSKAGSENIKMTKFWVMKLVGHVVCIGAV
jgi:hypothetical protein